MRAASLQLARIHARSTHYARFARDEIINSLRSALREEQKVTETVEKDQFFDLDTSTETTEAGSARPLYFEGIATRKMFSESTTIFHGLYSSQP